MKYRVRDFIFAMSCLLILSLGISVLIYTNNSYNNVEHKIIEFDEQNVDSVYLRVVDEYDQVGNSSLRDFLDAQDSLERMKEFNKRLKNEFNYVEYDHQNLMIKDDFTYKDEFRIDYDSVYYGQNDESGISLNSSQIGQNAYEELKISQKIEEGKGFQPEDFSYEQGKVISTLLGYEYKGLVNIGDTYSFGYLNNDISVKIIGFLKEDSVVTLEGNSNFLDNHIVIPFVDVDNIPVDEKEHEFQKILYSLKNWGYIKVNNGDDFLTYKDKIFELTKELRLGYVLSTSVGLKYMKDIASTINSIKGIFLIFSGVLFAILSVIFVLINIWNYNKNRKNYSIHLICGCSLTKIKQKIFVGVLIQFIVAITVATVINWSLISQRALYRIDIITFQNAVGDVVLFSLAVLLADCLIVNTYINKNNVYLAIRNEDG